MTPNDSRLISFLEDWRKRLLARHPGHSERLSEEEFGQLVTLNTVISYVTDSLHMTTPMAGTACPNCKRTDSDAIRQTAHPGGRPTGRLICMYCGITWDAPTITLRSRVDA